jgi:probable toxin-antitoxin system toxin component, PIN family
MSIVTVFDTNVWVSYFLNRQLEELVALKYDRDICFVRSADTLRELQLVLARPKFVKYFDLPIADYIENLPKISI